MAGDWIAMRHDLWDCPRVVSILSEICQHSVSTTADTLLTGSSAPCQQPVSKASARCRIVGALYRTWCIIDRFAEDGMLAGYTKYMLDEEVGWDGWCDQLERVGWLGFEPQGIVVPEFEEYFGRSAKRRLQNAKWKRASRKTRQHSVSNVADTLLTTEQKRTEQKRTIKKKTPLPPLSPELDTEDFRATWSLWERHRREIRKPLTPTCIKQQIAKMGEMGPQRAIAAMKHTIAMGWQGLREPELTPDNGKPQSTKELVDEIRRKREARK